ncbi:rubrerythrin-like domain-containing protein [Halonotius pteroides]|uniref:DUF7129 domain-containing protein n=1 Tax=Halonotius pteroides TaxID=268735 RepID=A0A3A6Q095_9EURY|nr:rubrerythrin-like domain-containing protein [Halonotius pteroides]RJX49841.1 hypothetical protein DP106_06940 [Halonotius pteroides]
MALHFPTLHSAADAGSRFECTDCGARLEETNGSRQCPACGAAIRNIAVPRN